MSVLIRGMEMPHDCEECKLCVIIPVGEYQILRKCVVLNRRAEYVIRRKDCPLVSVPPHGRLIDADALIAAGWQLSRDNIFTGKYEIALLSSVPTIIPAEEGET